MAMGTRRVHWGKRAGRRVAGQSVAESLEARRLLVAAPALDAAAVITPAQSCCVNLNWTAEAGASLVVEELGPMDDNFHVLQGVSGSPGTCAVDNLQRDIDYTFRLRAERDGLVAYSGEVTVHTGIPGSSIPTPSGLTAAVAGSSVHLSWQGNGWNQGFWVFARSKELGYSSLGGVLITGATSADIDVLQNNQACLQWGDVTFSVAAWDGRGNYSAQSNSVTAPPVMPLAAPVVSGVGNADGTASLSWSAVPGASIYYLFAGNPAAPTPCGTVTGTSITRALPGALYWVSAGAAMGVHSGYSNVVDVTPVTVAAPGEIHGTLGGGRDRVRLVWSNTPNNEQGYRLQIRLSGGTSWSDLPGAGADVTAEEITLPADYAGKSYDVRIWAFKDMVSSGYATTTVSGIALQGVGFAGSLVQHTKRDVAQTEYSWPEWWDENCDGTIAGEGSAYLNHTIDISGQAEHRYPASYLRSTDVAVSRMSLRGWLNYKGVVGQNWRFLANGGGYSFTLTAIVGGTDPQVVLDTTQALPSTIWSSYIHFTLVMSTDGGWNWFGLGSNDTQVYVTGAAADGASETVLDLGCGAANGMSPDTQAGRDSIFSAIWGQFAGCAVKRVDRTPLVYWGPDARAGVAGMLQSGSGTCEAWARLLVDIACVQGVVGVRTRHIVGEGGADMLIKGWTFQGTGTASGPNGYCYQPTEYFAGTRIQAQNNPNSPDHFGDHYIVEYNGRLFDPSYGTGGPTGFGSLAAWEDAALAGFRTLINNEFLGKQNTSDPETRFVD